MEEQIISIISEVNEIYAKTEIKQKYKNSYACPIEIKLQFPILPYYNLTKFTVLLDNKTIISKILESEKGKEKYNDEISSGNTAVYGSIFDSGEKMEVNIGNFLPNKTIEVKVVYLQNINSEDMSYCFSLIQTYPKIIINRSDNYFENVSMKGIKCNIYLTTQSSLTRFILLNKRKDINYITDFSQSLTHVKIYFEKNNVDNKNFKFLPYSTLKILFRTENINIPIIYSQYNEEKDETYYLIRYMYSNIEIPSKLTEKINNGEFNDLHDFYPENFIDMDQSISYNDNYGIKLTDEKSYSACYIFIIDQSSSMTGENFEILKQTLILFLKSLPFGSFFQIVGFGLDFVKYNEKPILYNKENVKETIELILKLKANLWPSNLFQPLENIFKQKIKKNLPTNIIIITDGKVNNVGKCLYLINMYSKYNRVHCIGIGENYNKYFIEEAAKIGRGLKFFIQNIQNLTFAVFNILNLNSLKYSENINIDLLNYNEYFNKRKYNIFLNSYYIIQNDIISYGFICPGKFFSSKDKKIIKIKINCNNDSKDNKEIDIKDKEILNNGEELGKIIIGSLINDTILNKNLKQDDIIELSKNYQVLSKYTCFFGSFKNEEKNKNKMIKINQFYLPDDQRPNVKIYYPKTGKHGHAKKIKEVLNEEEIKCGQLIEKNFDNNENDIIIIKNEEFNLFKKLIEEQDIEDGSWEKKFFCEEKYNDNYNKICDYFDKQNIVNKDFLKKICCSYFIIYVLNENYSRYLNIWLQIAQKGLYFLKINGIDYNQTKLFIFKK